MAPSHLRRGDFFRPRFLSFFFRPSTYIPLLLVLLLLVFFAFFYSTNCGEDDVCFLEKSKSCRPAKVLSSDGDAHYKYVIKGRHAQNCVFSVTLLDLDESSGVVLPTVLEGKSMTCSLPRELVSETRLKDIEGLSSYCSGPLKEASLEISIQKMYEIIVQNLGPLVATQFKNSASL